MHRKWVLVLGLLLIAFGIVGGIAALVVSSREAASGRPSPVPFSPSRPFGGFSSNGQRIYFTGIGDRGAIPRAWNPPRGFGGMMRGRGMMLSRYGCIACHGANGTGGQIMFARTLFEVPDIRYSTLTSPHQEETGTVPGWTEAQIETAIRDGVDPSGEKLDALMPRWEMDSTDMRDLIGYLKELSR